MIFQNELNTFAQSIIDRFNWLDNGFSGGIVLDGLTGFLDEKGELTFNGITDDYGNYISVVGTGKYSIDKTMLDDCNCSGFVIFKGEAKILLVTHSNINTTMASMALSSYLLTHKDFELKSVNNNSVDIVNSIFQKDEANEILAKTGIQELTYTLFTGELSIMQAVNCNPDCDVKVCNNC